MLKRQIQHAHSSTTSKVWNSIPDGVFNFSMNSEIQKISERLQEISERKDQLSLKIDTGAFTTKACRNISPSSSQPNGPMIGRDEDKRKIVELLSKQEHHVVNFDVVAIVGMAGVGKTTLVGQVLNDMVATQTFQPTVWVCVSDHDFNLERVTKQILESITSRQCTTEDYNKVQDYLHKELAGKKFLIVLDNVWKTCSYGEWMKLQSPFRDGAQGSKIIVTTRDTDVSKMMGTATLVHNLEPMESSVCLQVFEQHAFLNSNDDKPPNYELLKEKIAAKCRGLPLSARTLGGVLLRKDAYEWENILNNKLWSLSTSTLHNSQTLILEGCSKLEALPADMSNLINLHHLNNSNVSLLEGMPPQLGRLVNLQSLTKFVVSGGGDRSRIRRLEFLLHLRGTLCISRLKNVTDVEDARRANLKCEERLDSLVLEWSHSSDTRNGIRCA